MGLSEKIYKKYCIHRYDGEEYLHYFSYTDFPNLKFDKYEFYSKNTKLCGGFFYYDNYKEDSLIVFCHGIGGGYPSYMREIEILAKNGYKVLAFDYIGCCSSEGKDTISMTESLVNLDACLNSLFKLEEYNNKKITVIGHSWGGFAAGNILKYYPNLHAVVDISGFISIDYMTRIFMQGPLKIFRRGVKKYEAKANPRYKDVCTIDTLNNAKSKALVIHDKNDTMVPFDLSTKLLMENVKNPNVKFIITEGKYHNPQYSKDASDYMRDTFREFGKKCKNKEIKTKEDKKNYFKNADWIRMTNQDEEIYNEIIKFIE